MLPSVSNKISIRSKDRPTVKYLCTNSIITPYKTTKAAILTDIAIAVEILAKEMKNGKQNKTVSKKNIPR